MDRITLQNYRCFGSEEQSARLAPLTLLVGPNSTGKTSFLALIRALWDVAFREVVPNFREHPYDLGSWDDIVYDPGGLNQKKADWFEATFQLVPPADRQGNSIKFATKFLNHSTAPFPKIRNVSNKNARFELELDDSFATETARYSIADRAWKVLSRETATNPHTGTLSSISFARWSQSTDEPELEILRWLIANVEDFSLQRPEPFASAPTRSRPIRTYNPILFVEDAEGAYVPSYLAWLFRQQPEEWKRLKTSLEEFGAASELFDEIQVRSFGRSDGDPFQIQVRKHSGSKSRRRKGPWRNLIDVGYGVSQALPVLTELLRPDGPTMFLLQQPEVHLHPQAQAALGTLFCNVAAGGKQVIIETHSDYIIDRVRMDVRDGTTGLKPEDVSILYFEPGERAVKIHSIRMDKMGNVLDAPPSYGKFFMDEVNRSIGLVKPDVRNR